jgi:thioredoxin 2
MSDPLHIVCGHCDSVVRVTADRLGAAPRCPKCHNELFDGHPLTLRTASFDKHRTRNDLPLVVDFWAPWCGPCNAMAPAYETASQRLHTKARFAKINSDEEPALSSRFNIRGIPTLLVFKGGNEVARQSGAMDVTRLMQWLNPTLS